MKSSREAGEFGEVAAFTANENFFELQQMK